MDSHRDKIISVHLDHFSGIYESRGDFASIVVLSFIQLGMSQYHRSSLTCDRALAHVP